MYITLHSWIFTTTIILSFPPPCLSLGSLSLTCSPPLCLLLDPVVYLLLLKGYHAYHFMPIKYPVHVQCDQFQLSLSYWSLFCPNFTVHYLWQDSYHVPELEVLRTISWLCVMDQSWGDQEITWGARDQTWVGVCRSALSTGCFLWHQFNYCTYNAPTLGPWESMMTYSASFWEVACKYNSVPCVINLTVSGSFNTVKNSERSGHPLALVNKDVHAQREELCAEGRSSLTSWTHCKGTLSPQVAKIDWSTNFWTKLNNIKYLTCKSEKCLI